MWCCDYESWWIWLCNWWHNDWYAMIGWNKVRSLKLLTHWFTPPPLSVSIVSNRYDLFSNKKNNHSMGHLTFLPLLTKGCFNVWLIHFHVNIASSTWDFLLMAWRTVKPQTRASLWELLQVCLWTKSRVSKFRIYIHHESIFIHMWDSKVSSLQKRLFQR